MIIFHCTVVLFCLKLNREDGISHVLLFLSLQNSQRTKFRSVSRCSQWHCEEEGHFFCYFRSQETPLVPSALLPCCASPANRFLSVFVGNMLPLTPCFPRDTASPSTRCDQNQSFGPRLSSICKSCDLFCSRMYTVKLDSTVFLSLFLVSGQDFRSFQRIVVLLHRTREGWLGEAGKSEKKRRARQNVNTSCRGQAVLKFGILKDVIYYA